MYDNAPQSSPFPPSQAHSQREAPCLALSPLVKTLQNCYTDKAVQEFLLRGICAYPVAGLPGVATPGGCRIFRFLASSIPQHHPKINGRARARGQNRWHRLRSRFNGGMAPQFTGRPLFKCYRKKNQRGNVLSLVLFCLSTGACWPHLYGCAGVTSRYGRPP